MAVGPLLILQAEEEVFSWDDEDSAFFEGLVDLLGGSLGIPDPEPEKHGSSALVK